MENAINYGRNYLRMYVSLLFLHGVSAYVRMAPCALLHDCIMQ